MHIHQPDQHRSTKPKTKPILWIWNVFFGESQEVLGGFGFFVTTVFLSLAVLDQIKDLLLILEMRIVVKLLKVGISDDMAKNRTHTMPTVLCLALVIEKLFPQKMRLCIIAIHLNAATYYYCHCLLLVYTIWIIYYCTERRWKDTKGFFLHPRSTGHQPKLRLGTFCQFYHTGDDGSVWMNIIKPMGEKFYSMKMSMREKECLVWRLCHLYSVRRTKWDTETEKLPRLLHTYVCNKITKNNLIAYSFKHPAISTNEMTMTFKKKKGLMI
jgi:hypothetical protein